MPPPGGGRRIAEPAAPPPQASASRQSSSGVPPAERFNGLDCRPEAKGVASPSHVRSDDPVRGIRNEVHPHRGRAGAAASGWVSRGDGAMGDACWLPVRDGTGGRGQAGGVALGSGSEAAPPAHSVRGRGRRGGVPLRSPAGVLAPDRDPAPPQRHLLGRPLVEVRAERDGVDTVVGVLRCCRQVRARVHLLAIDPRL